MTNCVLSEVGNPDVVPPSHLQATLKGNTGAGAGHTEHISVLIRKIL